MGVLRVLGSRLGILLVSAALIVLHACGDSASAPADAGDHGDTGGPMVDAGTEPGGEDAGDANAITPSNLCGNARLDGDEECDDGNDADGDGCGTDCRTESGFRCVVAGADCEECGNGIVESSEECDDGNPDADDGCSGECAIEDGWVCPVPGQACESCGNGILEPNERCDEGNAADGVGCSDDCRSIDLHFDCPVPGEACVECGDGSVGGNELCDDGNVVSGDGCVFNCTTVEPAWRCAPDGGPCTLCGDGSIDGDEECDDGNFVGDDGCSVFCEREPGGVCFFPGVLCSKCGNGFIEFITLDDNGTPSDPSDDFFDASDPTAKEECDDGNQDADDGCSDTCEIEDGGSLPWLCPVPGLGCGRCGDAKVQDIEACDDGVGGSGDPEGGDGCSADCTTIEPSYHCPPDGGACVECGDGTLDASLEECDDSNVLSGDGCNRLCELETSLPWICPVAGAPCELCGNGVVEPHEACDDGDRMGTDGCSADCQTVEDTYNCFFGGFPCARCGDGLVSPGEKCDEGDLDAPAQATAGCDDECQVVSPWLCPIPDASCELCGDAVVGTTETCEDGNAVSGDGCSSVCQLEPGFDCSSGTCLAAFCGDGFAAGEEECDDGNSLSGDGCSFVCDVEDGWTCAGGAGCRRTTCGDGVVEGDEECDDGNTMAVDGCDADCLFEVGFTCPVPDAPCVPAICGDSVVEGYEQCDDGDADPLDGCDADCRIEVGFQCPDPGMDCIAAVCGNGIIEGIEACDDMGTTTGDGCDDACNVESLYRCEDEPSDCRSIVEFVVIQRFIASSVNPVALNYDPERRSFAGHKSSDSQPPVELCLDGSLLDPTDTSYPHGAIVAPDGDEAPLPISCADDPNAVPCYEYPLRPIHNNPDGAMVGSAYDPFTDHTLFLSASGGTTTLTEIPRGFDEATQAVADFQVELSGLTGAAELTVGEDGDLYVADDADDTIVVFVRRRDMNLDIVVPDCATLSEANCTSFASSPDPARGWSAPADDALQAIFTVPGEGLIGVFNAYTGGDPYLGMDLFDPLNVQPVASDQYFSFYDPALSIDPPLYGRSALPGLLFDLGTFGTTLAKYGKSAETAADGGAFIVCPQNPSEPCELFARTCSTNADCAGIVPGTECTGTIVRYCHAPGAARDDAYQVDRDAVGVNDPIVFDVLANDSPSESACIDPRLTVLSVCGDEVTEPYEAANPTHCPDDTMPPGMVTFSPVPGGDVSYDAPDDGSCGFVATFTYTADLGGGVIDTATVRVVVACICGDGVVDSNEQCDQGADNAPPGTLLDDQGTPEPDDDVYARCGTECFFNVFCSDGYIVAPEECDDRNTENGDGCSTFCTLESVCGDGQIEGVEQCDGDTPGFDDCNDNCTIPSCSDGNVDVQAPFLETCDDGNRVVGDGCDFDCHIETVCGNGIPELGEDCDDGNTVSGDGCTAICTIENVCGNDIAEGSEECDGDDFGGCPVIMSAQIQCTNEPVGAPNICLCANYCGDGMIGGTEECDDGAGGSATCRGSAPANGEPCTRVRCGDGIKDGSEQCDDGNTNPADGCTNDCKVIAICGNGTTEGAEECDDGNNVSGDGCSSACKDEATVCGDGVLDFDEQCDDGNTSPGDGCDPMCLLEGGSCGDGTVDLGEQCDDGNTTGGDGCSASCQLDLCGNGTVNNGEECDDGNTTSGDGCSSLCRHEVQ